MSRVCIGMCIYIQYIPSNIKCFDTGTLLTLPENTNESFSYT